MIDQAVDVCNVLHDSVRTGDQTVSTLQERAALFPEEQRHCAAAAPEILAAMARARSEIEALKRFYAPAGRP